MLDHPTLDHSIVHRDVHGGCVRIVGEADIAEAETALRLMFPHETVLTTTIGCGHRCVYTADAPASLVADRIAEHLRDVEHRPD